MRNRSVYNHIRYSESNFNALPGKNPKIDFTQGLKTINCNFDRIKSCIPFLLDP